MPIHTLNPVRLMNTNVSAGFQLCFLSESAAAKGVAQLPLLARRISDALNKEYPMVRFSIEAAATGENKGLSAKIHCALNVRFLFPATVSAAEASDFCLDLRDETLDFINRGETIVSELRSGEEGTLARIPHSSGLCFLTKQRCVVRTKDGSLLHYAPAARISAPVDLPCARDALLAHPGCGVSLFLSPAQEEESALLLRAAQELDTNSLAHAELTQIAQRDGLMSMQLIVWGKDKGKNRTLARELHAVLQRSGLSCRLSIPARTDEMQHYQLIHDPWALFGFMNKQLGGRLAASASLYGSDELNALLRAGEDTKDAADAQDALVYAVRFSEEELAALGVKDEEELLDKSMSQEQIDMLRTAVTQIRTILADETLSPVMPYAATLGFFYEMMVRACIEPGLLKEENNFRARTNPDYKPWTEEPALSLFDNINYSRVRNYAACVSLGGKRLLPFAWNVWFNCLKCMRLMRNKVHAQLGSVEREEVELMYRLMLFPGHEHKINALRYFIDHPHPRADDFKNKNLKILHCDANRSAEELLDFIKKSPTLFEESLLSFILRCADGKWDSSI